MHFGADPQQLLLRLGGIYTLQKAVKFGGGYTNFTTHTYGQHPSAELGEPTPEHRAYEDMMLGADYGRLHLAHRVRLEQRWLRQLGPTWLVGSTKTAFAPTWPARCRCKAPPPMRASSISRS